MKSRGNVASGALLIEPERDEAYMAEKIKDKNADKAKDQERELDEGLEETFPASDPPASTQPGEGGPDTAEPSK